MPPPIPNIPASTPAASPIAMNRITIRQVEVECSGDRSSGGVKRCRASSGGYSFLHCVQHLVREDIDLVQSRVDVRRYSNSPEFRMDDRRVHDPVLIQQPGAKLDVVDAFDLKQRESARLPVVQRSENRYALALRQ